MAQMVIAVDVIDVDGVDDHWFTISPVSAAVKNTIHYVCQNTGAVPNIIHIKLPVTSQDEVNHHHNHHHHHNDDDHHRQQGF